MALVLLEASGSGPMPSDDVAARYLAFSLHFDFGRLGPGMNLQWRSRQAPHEKELAEDMWESRL